LVVVPLWIQEVLLPALLPDQRAIMRLVQNAVGALSLYALCPADASEIEVSIPDSPQSAITTMKQIE